MIDRRKLLQLVAAGLISDRVLGQANAADAPRFFTKAELALVDRLSEAILPADERSGGASEAEVADFIDLVLAHSDEDDQALWRNGVASIEAAAQVGFDKPFADLSDDQVETLVAAAASEEERPKTAPGRFFPHVKRLTLMGYYASPVGLHQELRYQGNLPQADFPACDHPEHGAA